MNIVIGTADCRVSSDMGSVLVTYGLGSCIGVSIYDEVARVGGLLHYLLPESTADALVSGKSPYTFADTGIPMLFREAYRLGADRRRLRVRVAGGAQVIEEGLFDVGRRNYLALKKILWRAGFMVHAEEIGGKVARTIRLEMATGRVFVRSPDRPGDREL